MATLLATLGEAPVLAVASDAFVTVAFLHLVLLSVSSVPIVTVLLILY
jgi:hypothetical protein